MKKLYVASAVAHAPDEFVAHIEKVRALAEEKGYEVLRYVGSMDALPSAVYTHDRAQVLAADVVLAELSYPSTGMGFEIALALHQKIPVIGIAQQGTTVSRMIEGIEDEHYTFHRYTDVSEIEELL